MGFAWLIETSQSSWWSGNGYSTDANEAVRFSRKEDAEKVISTALDNEMLALIATEHGWLEAEWVS